MWLNPVGAFSDEVLWGIDDGTSNNYLMGSWDNSGNYAVATSFGGEACQSNTTTGLVTNTWYHICTVLDGAKLIGYVNGKYKVSDETCTKGLADAAANPRI